MLYCFGKDSSEPIEVLQLEVIHQAFHSTTAGTDDVLVDTPLSDVFPLARIPIECEDAPIHDGVNPCGETECPCATYGYGVPSLE